MSAVQTDEYSPEVKPYVRNNRTLTMNEISRNQTESEESLYTILSRGSVRYRAQDFVRIVGEFWPTGIPVVLHPDVIIDDPRFGSGIIEVDGTAHKTRGARRRDAKKDEWYAKMGYWVERLPNSEVKLSVIMAILAQHVREVKEFP